MGTGNKNNDQHEGGIPVKWSEADWPVEVEVRSRRFAAELVETEPRTRGRSHGGARAAHDAWFIWRTSQTRVPRRNSGFTLIELLVVIAVIAILAGLLLPTLMGVKIRARVRVTKSELNNLAAAITQYESEYSRPPMTKDALNLALKGGPPEMQDFTYGGTLQGPSGNVTVESHNTGLSYKTNNAELIAILQKDNQSTIQRLQDLSKAMNPRQMQFFDKKRVDQTDVSGIGPDNIFRDAWGNPYIISIDVNDDGVVYDGAYSKIYQNDGPPRPLGIRAPVAIWSAGPDLKVDPKLKSKEGVNRDNIVSWE